MEDEREVVLFREERANGRRKTAMSDMGEIGELSNEKRESKFILCSETQIWNSATDLHFFSATAQVQSPQFPRSSLSAFLIGEECCPCPTPRFFAVPTLEKLILLSSRCCFRLSGRDSLRKGSFLVRARLFCLREYRSLSVKVARPVARTLL